MKSEAIVMTIDFVKDHFNAIHLGKQLKLISRNGHMINISDDNQRTLPGETGLSANQLIIFFRA